MGEPERVRAASLAFSGSASADAVLQTSDGVSICVSKASLAGASPFFRDMFALEQPSTQTSSDPSRLCSIPLEEDSSIIDPVLRIISDRNDFEPRDLNTIGRVLEVAKKYQLRRVEEAAQNWIWPHVYTHSLETYALACRFNIEEVAAAAAEVCRDHYQRKFPKPDSAFVASVEGACYIPEMDNITAGQYFRLIQFVRASMDTVDTRPFSFCQPRFTTGFRNAQKRLEQPARVIPAHVFPESLTQAPDLVLKSTDQHEFRVHRLIIELAGGRAFIEGAVETASDGLPLSRVGAIGWVLALIVQLCYPCGGGGIFQDLFAAREVLRVATRYGMAPLVALAQAKLMQLLPSAPLRIFFLFAEHDWLAPAEHAARALAQAHLEDVYVPEMEDVAARAYYRLLRYHHECRTTIQRVASRHADYVQGWRAVSKRTQTNLAALAVPLPIVEMWTQKMLAAQDQSHIYGHAVGSRGVRTTKRPSLLCSGPLAGPDLQTDFVDAGNAMHTEIEEEILKLQPKLHEA